MKINSTTNLDSQNKQINASPSSKIIQYGAAGVAGGIIGYCIPVKDRICEPKLIDKTDNIQILLDKKGLKKHPTPSNVSTYLIKKTNTFLKSIIAISGMLLGLSCVYVYNQKKHSGSKKS